MHPTRNDLPEEIRQAVCQLLNARLADAIDMSLQAKQAHWNVKGPHFIALHELFDKVHGMAEEQIDVLAERITALAGRADGTLSAISGKTTLKPYPLEIVSGVDHTRAVADALAEYGKVVRKGIGEADELGDAGSADVFTGISRSIDQMLWFVESHLEGNS